MGRSNSRSHSSRSRSPSSSRSRSHSRKKRYSSRSRSRTYSRSRSRERVYNRDFHRDYRNNRGMRRPYGFRGRSRGYYQGGGGRYHRGGYRPMWNRRYSRSPRRGRSRSRSPKRRSASSQRSRSRSQRSYKSSQSQRSSSSRSSSRYSKSPEKKSRASREKPKQKKEEAAKSKSPSNEKSGDEHKDAFDPSEPLDELGKELDLHGESWAGLSAYDNSPRSPCSPSPVASPPSESSSQSDGPILSVVHSGKDTMSQNSHSMAHSPERSGSASGDGNGSTRYSPSQNSPIHIPLQKSPAKTVVSQNASHDEGHSHYSMFTDPAEQDITKGAKFLKKYTDEEHRLFPIEKANNRETESHKDKTLEKTKKEAGRNWDDRDMLDYLLEKESVKSQFLSVSESEDLEEAEDYRQFRKSVLAEQGKSFSSTSQWNAEEEGTKFKSKSVTKGSKESEKVKEGKGHKMTTKERHKDDDKGGERSFGKKEPKSPNPVRVLDKIKNPVSCNFPLHPSNEVREKVVFREESPLRIRIIATESHHVEVKLRMPAVPLDDIRPSSLSNDRRLASTLVHSIKKPKDFRSIFDHMKVSFSNKTSPESFIYHVVSLVQFVKEHYFKGDGKTLSERFAEYQTVTDEPASRPKSPEIHRRLDLSPNILRKHPYMQNEDTVFVAKEEPSKIEKKVKSSSIDLRGDTDRRRKERSKERGDSKCSRESSDSRKREKAQKEHKELKVFKDDNKRRKDHEPSPPLSDDDKDNKKESRDEEFKGPMEPKEFPGFPGTSRPRGTFFRIRGRGRARGVFAGTSTAPVNTAPSFQKRSKEEEWDPEYTPKSKKYFLHDDRDDGVDYWARRARGRGNFQRGRGRFPFKKSGSSPKWTHDKYQGDGLVDEEEEAMEERRKDEKE
ncbi:bcl-2-associated transcription factor 1 isoform X2 [Bufo bufo]|uniref:bcl-2-associated transcription factor 1 isoform X2 n=1 Tax=Bufo bufo TaxID=8384 RepID=UPI001ABDBA17|nr:bcl-2-associated transcription factor 1 isoform X2 [Bufo bufo]